MIDFARLATQGRAYNGARAWECDELEALVTLERERGIPRLVAADHVRNGIMTVEAFDEATKAEFKPKTLEEAQEVVEVVLKDNEFAKKKTVKKGKK